MTVVVLDNPLKWKFVRKLGLNYIFWDKGNHVLLFNQAVVNGILYSAPLLGYW